MTTKTILAISVLLMCIGCGNSNTNTEECIDNILSLRGMESYTGVIDDDCNDYLLWQTYNGANYFTLANPCADYAQHLLDCDNIDLVTTDFEEYELIVPNLVNQGIVGRK